MPANQEANGNANRELKHKRILRAAIEVFSRKGYFSARMTDVAKAADVADGTLYLYFEGKEHLLISIFDDVFSHYTQQVKSVIAEIPDPVDKLHAVVRLHLELVGQDRELAHILQIETRHSRRFMNLLTRGRLGDYFGLIRSVIDEGQRSGAFRTDISPGLAIVFVFGAVDEAVTSWLLADEPGDLSRHVDPLVSLFTSGILANGKN